MRRLLTLFSLSCVAFLSLGASSCSTDIKNIEFCRDKGKFGAVCAYWLNAKETKKVVPALEWNAKRLGMVCTSEEGFGQLNALIEKLCQRGHCKEKIEKLIKAIEVGESSEVL